MTLEPRVCQSPQCGKTFEPRRADQKNCSRACHAKSRTARGRSEQSKQSSKNRDLRVRRERTAERVYMGIDGEGVTQRTYLEEEDLVIERHVYVYMAAHSTDGETYQLENEDGSRLTTDRMLWWLWKIGKGRSLWFFSGKYDQTHMLYDLLFDADLSVLRQIFHPETDLETGEPRSPFEPIWWGDWGITIVQGSMTLSRRFWKEDGTEFTIERFFQDAFKCFGGGSFVAMLKNWDVGTPEQRDRVAAMKEKRATFGYLTQTIRDYCIEEVTLLAEAVQKIVGIFNELDIRPMRGRWYSAGSPAKALLRTHHIPADPEKGWDGYRGPDRYAGAPEHVIDILLRTFFGGWFDLAETGIFPELHSKDLKSAYPAVIKTLPCLAHGHWEERFVPGAVNFGHVRWEPTRDGYIRWAPFPWRWPDGKVYRPVIGQGWYCEAEIRSAQKLADYDIEELGWISFVPECDHQPFGWVQDVYDLRVSLGGDGKGLALKVTLNSVYGTFADTLSVDSVYASVIWAALITGGTRARILDQIAEHGDSIIAVATDGIISDKPLEPVEKTNILGAWNYEGPLYDVLMIQPGLYLAANGNDPKKQVRNRGHNINDMREMEHELRKAWTHDGWDATVEYERTRLIPAKLALTRKNPLEVYGQWVTEPVKVKFRPSNRETVNDSGPRKRSTPSWRHLIAKNGTLEDDSAPYDRYLSIRANERLILEKELRDAQP